MQVDHNLYGDPIRNLWAAVILTALDDLKIRFEQNPKWSSGINRQLNRRQAIWFFSRPEDSSLSWICKKLNLDLQATVKKAHEICPEVKIIKSGITAEVLNSEIKRLSFEKVECYYENMVE